MKRPVKMFIRQYASFPEELAWYRLSRGQAMWPFDPEDVYAGIFGMVAPDQDPIPMTLWVAKIVQQLLGYRRARSVVERLIRLPIDEWYTKDTVNQLVAIVRKPNSARELVTWLAHHCHIVPFRIDTNASAISNKDAAKHRFRWSSEVVRCRWPHLSSDIVNQIIDIGNKVGLDAELGAIVKELGLSAKDQRLCLAADIVQDLVVHGHNIPKSKSVLERLAVEIDLQQPLRDSLTLLADRLIELDLLLSGLEQEHLNGLSLPNRSLILITAFHDNSLDGLLGDTPTLVELAELDASLGTNPIGHKIRTDRSGSSFPSIPDRPHSYPDLSLSDDTDPDDLLLGTETSFGVPGDGYTTLSIHDPNLSGYGRDGSRIHDSAAIACNRSRKTKTFHPGTTQPLNDSVPSRCSAVSESSTWSYTQAYHESLGQDRTNALSLLISDVLTLTEDRDIVANM